jgi:hypothetical protein
MRDTIDMAREAGAVGFVHDAGETPIQWIFRPDELKAFEALVRADAIADEREACAKMCEKKPETRTTLDGPSIRETVGKRLAAAIRERGNT